ncbi:hypothetical protein GY45DRAFT_1335030 [Cubamyces sp. BRFM 1775]|nr:hypothetical protein GY45DRAFT_1335030 [Cubamyces sp. BRFM 1775]
MHQQAGGTKPTTLSPSWAWVVGYPRHKENQLRKKSRDVEGRGGFIRRRVVAAKDVVILYGGDAAPKSSLPSALEFSRKCQKVSSVKWAVKTLVVQAARIPCTSVKVGMKPPIQTNATWKRDPMKFPQFPRKRCEYLRTRASWREFAMAAKSRSPYEFTRLARGGVGGENLVADELTWRIRFPQQHSRYTHLVR